VAKKKNGWGGEGVRPWRKRAGRGVQRARSARGGARNGAMCLRAREVYGRGGGGGPE